ncbi:MAG: GTP 3',8-cyclase MoaA, partial [Candidatus Firestonebacteria bacterium]|nr:GTP 3',8-cyclase MoaA [Candidatus Firestonebacteria bacterium]
MKDSFGRQINYLRISITDRCNLRCEYCMPLVGIEQIASSEILNFDEIIKIINFAVKQGINRIKITGGEPFVRKDFLRLMERIVHIPGIKDIGITTNGILLEEYAEKIYKLGIRRINISLDTLQKEKFKMITHRDEFHRVSQGIEKALNLGFTPVKINVVIIKGINDDEIEDFVRLTNEQPLHLRFIGFMPVGVREKWSSEKYISSQEIKNKIKELFPSKKITGSGPATYYKINGSKGSIGFIDCLEKDFCSHCNRLRLTSDGKLRSCLFSDSEIDLKKTLREGASDSELEKAFSQAIKNKPVSHPLYKNLGILKRTMSKIGG